MCYGAQSFWDSTDVFTTYEEIPTNIVTVIYAIGKKLVVETFFDCHRSLNRAEVVKEFINDFNNSVHLSMKGFKKVVAILID